MIITTVEDGTIKELKVYDLSHMKTTMEAITLQLSHILEHDSFSKNKCIQICTSETLPSIIRYPTGVICNVGMHKEEESHWIAMYFPYYGGRSEFFDPYGHHPEIYGKEFVSYLYKNGSCMTYNRRCLQSPTSKMSDQFCFYFVMNRNRLKSLSKISHSFENDPSKNDQRVKVFIRRVLNRAKAKEDHKKILTSFR